MIVLITTADTEVLAARRAVAALPPDFPEVRSLNPSLHPDPVALADELADAGPAVVLVRLLGGRRAWADGFDRLAARCRDAGVPLLAFSGEATADAELTAASTAPAGALADAFEYLVQGGVANTAQLLRFVADTLVRTGFGFEPPEPLPEEGRYGERAHDPARPTVGVVFYRTHWMSGNTGFVDVLCDAIEDAGANALPVFCYSLRPRDGEVAALDLLRGQVDAVVTTVLAMGGANAADSDDGWAVPALEALDVPVLQAVCATSSRAAWAASDQGLSPLDTAMQVALPEFDGRIVSAPFSFKQVRDGVATYAADPERAARVAGTAVRLARLRRDPARGKRVAVVLSNYPTKHSRIGNAVGLDTPASAVAVLDALTAAGYDTGTWAAERAAGAGEDRPPGDALVHALIAAGGFDTEFLTDEQLARQPARLPAGRYAERFARLDAGLAGAMTATWGPPPGELYVHDGDLAFAALRYGDVLVAVQPPRGFGENPVAIYHDPDLAPTHHYLAFYRWLDEEWGADAIVHLGKHGTLEWMPGKGLGLSAACAPDAILGDVPLLYPFVVNDPGEGTQAKRRGHALIVDHLVPPMTRAETYDELARLEQLLDEYYHVQVMDPAKQRALQGEIWHLLRAAELTRDLGLADRGEEVSGGVPPDFDDLIVHVDGYLCEIKDLQIRGGLHVLGRAPTGEDRVGLVLAILRLPQAGVEGLRQAVAATFGLDEAALLDKPGAPAPAPPALVARFPGPARTASDLVDRLEEAARALVEAMDARRWDPGAAGAVTAEILGDPAPEVARTLAFAGTDVVPRLDATDRELGNLVRGLAGRYVPAGPSGSPTRGRADVLPTGKNFYSVDPKALPSELSWQVGQRLAADLVARHVEEEGVVPRQVGIVVWGTAAMRTHGDDIAEILALLGVRPVWNRESRRVTGLELISLAELARPRVDVTVRISGFFRDAFPHLVTLLDDAVAMVAGLDEPGEDNPLAANAHADRERLVAEGVAPDEAARRATARVFGSKPGAYGAGLLPLIDARNWQTDADLAEVYATWGGYAYGRGLDGAPARADMERTFARMQVAVKNTDTREHDLLDSDDYFQYHGGMVAAVRALTGTSPKAYIGDSADPARVRTRDLREETARVFRARVANPKWIAAMARHGYKGAFELSATVDYLFGYDATAGVVEDWMYETLSAKYVFDADVRAFLEQSNPWALRAITERLLEAADRSLWAEPDPDTLGRLRATYLELEGDLEDRS
ncbi:MAG TPA: cobaltochelatase subunit CobN [Egibacteraceae bacterium]|nr:cobaltochelatase subunit CobN [Egibacteraceae bacterium]